MAITNCLPDHVAEKACLRRRVTLISLGTRLASLFLLEELFELVLLVGIFFRDLVGEVNPMTTPL